MSISSSSSRSNSYTGLNDLFRQSEENLNNNNNGRQGMQPFQIYENNNTNTQTQNQTHTRLQFMKSGSKRLLAGTGLCLTGIATVFRTLVENNGKESYSRAWLGIGATAQGLLGLFLLASGALRRWDRQRQANANNTTNNA